MNVAYWLLVERLVNRQIDKAEGFRRFGLSERHKALADQMKKGDILIFYVSSGISKFSDVRQTIADGTAKLGSSGDYDTAFPISISTRLQFALDRNQWVPFHDLKDKLSITAGKGEWRQIMRSSLRRLSDEDAAVIIGAMKCAGKVTST